MDKQMTLSAFSDELANVRTTKKEFVVIPFSKPFESPGNGTALSIK
jgi:hypothetical protein